ncbi:sulfide:quinone reductase [Bowdeniella nasicola]|uniref:Sulfide:quinone reductase n=1 Tax=Bowdeniella nasicola TaxID=208480 RepID=A0A1Q5Q0Z8_9ACTO|nr:FAD-dependent oxidoreductase [Bowdeniella nasicola]OKL53372.1 sulfide:quinone reductase [Bowdeniella nasicola]
MARVVVLGAGVSGHTAALHLKRKLGDEHTITVVSPNSQWNWIPSNIWVGVGEMDKKDVLFPLAPVYAKKGIEFVQALAKTILPNGDEENPQGAVDVTYTSPERKGETERLRYDYLINATGPKLRFEATEGLGPDGGHSVSVCTADHAVHAAAELDAVIAKLKAGEKQTLVVGMGHGMCTCEGAAFEYVFNVDHELREAGVRDRAELIYLTNEAQLGDFGVDGMVFEERGFKQSSQMWTESIFTERNVFSILGAHVTKVDKGVIHYETLDGEHHTQQFDFAMLLPPFGGVGLTALDRDGSDITEELFAPNGFMRVDGDYTQKPYEQWRASDWPETYEVPGYRNIFAVGIAFAPPHGISKPRTSPNGTVIAPAPPRTGMPSGVMGKTVAMTIVDRIKGKPNAAHKAAMSRLGAACVASSGTGLRKGSAATMTMFPVVPNYEKYPDTGGRNLKGTRGQIGLSGHWMKLMLHYLFIYKAKARPGWSLIPE